MTVEATVDGVTVESGSGTAESLTAELTSPAAASGEGTPAAPVGGKPDAPPAADVPDPASEAGKTLAAARTKKELREEFQERIDKATWEKHEAIRKAEKAEADLAALKNPQQAAPAADTGRPKLKAFVDLIGTDYDTYEDAVEAHSEALTDYKLAARDTASSAAQHSQARNQALHQTATRGAEAHADFDAILGQFVEQGGRFAPANAQEANGPLGDLEQLILQHPLGHSVAYELAKDPALYQGILASTSRVMFMAEVGKLLTRLDGAPSGSPSTPAPVSKAKPPVKPVGGKPTASGGPPGDDASDEEHLAYMNQQDRARRRA